MRRLAEWAAVALAVVAVASSLGGVAADLHEPDCPPRLLETVYAGSVVCFTPNATGWYNPGQNEIVAVTVTSTGTNVTNAFTENGGGYAQADVRCFTWLPTNDNTPITSNPGSGSGAQLRYILYSLNGHTNSAIIGVLNSAIDSLVTWELTQMTAKDGRTVLAWGLTINQGAFLDQLKSNVALLAYDEARSLAGGGSTWDVVLGWNVQMWANLTQPISYTAPPPLVWPGRVDTDVCPIRATKLNAAPFYYQDEVLFKVTVSGASQLAAPSLLLLALLAAATALGRRT